MAIIPDSRVQAFGRSGVLAPRACRLAFSTERHGRGRLRTVTLVSPHPVSCVRINSDARMASVHLAVWLQRSWREQRSFLGRLSSHHRIIWTPPALNMPDEAATPNWLWN